MTPLVTADLRTAEFATEAELDHLVGHIIEDAAEEGDELGNVIISEYQLKLLRLERYMKGSPPAVVKTEWVSTVKGLPVAVVPDDAVIYCQGCGEIHESE